MRRPPKAKPINRQSTEGAHKTAASTIRQLALALSATTIAFTAQAAQRDYVVQDLAISVTTPMAMNNLGQMVGRGYFNVSSGQMGGPSLGGFADD